MIPRCDGISTALSMVMGTAAAQGGAGLSLQDDLPIISLSLLRLLWFPQCVSFMAVRYPQVTASVLGQGERRQKRE